MLGYDEGCSIQDLVVIAHASGLKADDRWWLAWHFDSVVVTNICILTAIYVVGVSNLWRKAGSGRVITHSRSISFMVGMVALSAALLSPMDVISNDLSWVHMIQHMVLMVVAAPLVMFGSPGMAVPWAIPGRWRKRVVVNILGSDGFWSRRLGKLFWSPIAIWTANALVLWIWHLPWLYEWALMDALVHDIEHLMFFVVSCLFWRIVVDVRRNRAIEPGPAVLYLFTTSIHSMFLGVFMALSPTPWYPIYFGRTQRWGFGILEDQQIAGMIMWMPACTSYAIVAICLFANWLNRLERRNARFVQAA